MQNCDVVMYCTFGENEGRWRVERRREVVRLAGMEDGDIGEVILTSQVLDSVLIELV